MYLVFDVGGTKLRMASSVDGVNLQNFEIRQTPQEFEKALEIIQQFVWRSNSTHVDNLLSMGVPGVLDLDKKRLVASPHLPLWVGLPIHEQLTNITKCRVLLSNDADLAGLGESVMGAGKDKKIVAFITISTGVGGVRIVNNKIDISKFGFEPGHQIIDADGSILGNTSSWEALVSGSGIKNRYSLNPEDINDSKTWGEINEYIGIGLINTIVHWSPDIVVLGGGITKNQNISIEKITSVIKKNLILYPVLPEIKKGILGDEAALWGGIEVLKSLNG